MYKIGIIQHSSGAPAPVPPPIINFQFNIDWTTIYHYTLSDTFSYTSARIRPTPTANISLDVYYDAGGTNDIFRLYYREDPGSGGLPVFNTNQSPLVNGGFTLVIPPADPMQGYVPILLSNPDAYVSFGVEAGPDFATYYPNGIASTRVIVTVANTTQIIDTFDILLDARF